MYFSPYISVGQSLVAGWKWKVPLALLWTELFHRLALLFEARFEFVALLIVLVAIDLITGVAKSLRNGGRVNSIGLRQTIIKVIEYAIFLFCIQGIANTFEIAAWVDDSAFLYVAVTEVTSILENLGVGSAAMQFWNELRDKLKSKG